MLPLENFDELRPERCVGTAGAPPWAAEPGGRAPGSAEGAAAGVGSDLRRAAAWFALPLAAASLIRLALEPQYWSASFLAWLAVLGAYAALQLRLAREPGPRQVRIALAANFAAIGVGYAMIGAALNAARGWRADDALYRIERALFGGDPQQFLARWRTPWLSTVAMLGYVSLVILLLYLFLSEAFRTGRATGRLQLGLMRLYGIGYASYLLFPAAGPHFHHGAALDPAVQSPLSAYLNAWVLRCCSRVDAWPSVHAAVCTFALIWTFRRDRRVFLLLILPGAALMLGTVYFQYHYFIDLPAGCLLGAACALSLGDAAPAAD